MNTHPQNEMPASRPSHDRNAIMDTLVNTYRELNTRYRTLDDGKLASSGARDIIDRMRRDEMLFAQALKERVSGVGHMGDADERNLFAHDTDDATVAQLISQFGTARATTLTLLKDIDEDTWVRELDDGQTILDHVRDLAESDTVQLKRLADSSL